MKKIEINHDLTARKWAITENILKVALVRRVSLQFIRQEILAELRISPALLSLLEKTDKSDIKNTLTVNVEDRMNDYFSRHLKKQIALNGNAKLALQMA